MLSTDHPFLGGFQETRGHGGVDGDEEANEDHPKNEREEVGCIEHDSQDEGNQHDQCSQDPHVDLVSVDDVLLDQFVVWLHIQIRFSLFELFFDDF